MRKNIWIILDLDGIIVSERKEIIDKSIAEYLNIDGLQFQELAEEYMSQITIGNLILFGFYSILVNLLKLSVPSESAKSIGINVVQFYDVKQ